MTSGANPRSGGTSMTGHSALATTVRLITGLSGSSLTIRSVQLLGPHEVGVKRMTTSTQKSWLTAAGNGLLTSVKSGQGATKETFVTFKLHRPTLQMEIVFSASTPAHTSLKSVEPVTRMSPVGALPETETTLLGTCGSLLATARVP